MNFAGLLNRWGLFAVVVLAIAAALQNEYYFTLLNFIGIHTLLVVGLNLLLGYAGQISLGHAAFFGGGAYVVAFLMQAGIVSAWITWPLAMFVAVGAALAIGALSLRTRGVYFIMITLAFAQMIYYSVISLQSAGGDDGLPLEQRPPTVRREGRHGA